MEKRDLYDRDKENTQFTIFKEQETPDNYYTLVVLALIQNSKNEILVQKRSIQKGGEYGLTSGHPKSGETSLSGIISEIKEELGKDVEITGYISTIENFFEMKGSKYHEIMFVHKIEFANEEDKKIEYTMKNIEGKDYLQYEWLEMDKIDEYPLLPRAVKDILKENKFPIHKINNDLK